MNSKTTFSMLALSATLMGCADTPHSDAHYGEAVRAMVQAQTYDPAAAANPPALAPEAGDGERIRNAIEVYRKDVAKGNEEVKQSVIFEVGQE
ncbi:MAG TPA: hypothetical protein VJS42_15015 [Steroidobacteraceae bacterium]|nr:hypothetical protein [Steroidobacteraceae bacterium]